MVLPLSSVRPSPPSSARPLSVLRPSVVRLVVVVVVVVVVVLLLLLLLSPSVVEC